jgi:hypothetical protein
MILSFNRYGVIDTICWDRHENRWDDALGIIDGDGDDCAPPLSPTHWMPLPSPPGLGGGSGEDALHVEASADPRTTIVGILDSACIDIDGFGEPSLSDPHEVAVQILDALSKARGESQ